MIKIFLILIILAVIRTKAEHHNNAINKIFESKAHENETQQA
jgi:hypothetical protein